MSRFSLPSLPKETALALASELAKSAGLQLSDGTLEAVTESTDGIPFYIHHVLRRISTTDPTEWTESNFTATFEECLAEPADPWSIRSDHFNRFESPDYYNAETRRFAVSFLDLVSESANAAEEKEFYLLGTQLQTTETESAGEVTPSVLDLLCQDHFLEKKGGKYVFKYGLLRRWWLVNKTRSGGQT